MTTDFLKNPNDPGGYLLSASGTLLVLATIDQESTNPRINYLVRRIQQRIESVKAAESLVGKVSHKRELILRVARLDLFEPYFNKGLDIEGGLEAVVKSFGADS